MIHNTRQLYDTNGADISRSFHATQGLDSRAGYRRSFTATPRLVSRLLVAMIQSAKDILPLPVTPPDSSTVDSFMGSHLLSSLCISFTAHVSKMCKSLRRVRHIDHTVPYTALRITELRCLPWRKKNVHICRLGAWRGPDWSVPRDAVTRS